MGKLFRHFFFFLGGGFPCQGPRRPCVITLIGASTAMFWFCFGSVLVLSAAFLSLALARSYDVQRAFARHQSPEEFRKVSPSGQTSSHTTTTVTPSTTHRGSQQPPQGVVAFLEVRAPAHCPPQEGLVRCDPLLTPMIRSRYFCKTNKVTEALYAKHNLSKRVRLLQECRRAGVSKLKDVKEYMAAKRRHSSREQTRKTSVTNPSAPVSDFGGKGGRQRLNSSGSGARKSSAAVGGGTWDEGAGDFGLDAWDGGDCSCCLPATPPSPPYRGSACRTH